LGWESLKDGRDDECVVMRRVGWRSRVGGRRVEVSARGWGWRRIEVDWEAVKKRKERSRNRGT